MKNYQIVITDLEDKQLALELTGQQTMYIMEYLAKEGLVDRGEKVKEESLDINELLDSLKKDFED